MKSRVCLFIPFMIFILLQGNVNSQTNSYFQNNPVWKINSAFGGSYPCITYSDFNYYLNGDTIVNSFTYKKVFRKDSWSYSWYGSPPPVNCSGSYYTINTNPSAFVRSDGKKIFLLNSDTSDVLLYDFDLAVNDTLPVTFVNYATDVVVTGIDSLLTPNGYLKLFQIYSSSGSTWSQLLIEGIGHDGGFLEYMGAMLEGDFVLNCYSLNDTAYYPSIGPTCNMNLNIKEYFDINSIQVYPNPFDNIFTVELDLKKPENLILEIVDISGRLISSRNYSGGSGKNQIEIIDSWLAKGIYYLVIRDQNNHIASKKIIKN